VKNILTNILGSLMLLLSVYGLLYLDLEVLEFLALTSVGGLLIYFKNATIKAYILKALNKYLK